MAKKEKVKKRVLPSFKNEHERLTFWARQIRAWRKSGLVRKEFAKENGFSVNAFDHYRYKLGLDKEIKPRGETLKNNEDVLVVGRVSNPLSKASLKSFCDLKLTISDLSLDNQKLVDSYVRYLELGGRSVSTVNNYKHCLIRFLKYYDECDVRNFTTDNVNEYIHDLLSVDHSHSYVNHMVFAICLFYRKIIKSELVKTEEIQKLRVDSKLPKVLTREEVLRILKVCGHNLKWQLWYSLIYSAGMRIDELVNLRASDILSEEGLIIIRKGKGKKERYTLLSNHVLRLLRKYWVEDPSDKKTWLFPSPLNFAEHVSTNSVSTIFRTIKNDAGIKRTVTCHGLRHSFATHMLDDGADIRVIQQLMGHVDIKTTVIYLSVSKTMLKKYPSPIDYFFKGLKKVS